MSNGALYETGEANEKGIYISSNSIGFIGKRTSISKCIMWVYSKGSRLV
jgi:hypothetical protein